MEYLKITFKNLTPPEKTQLIAFLKEFGVPHDLEVWEPDDLEEWEESKKKAYKQLKRSENSIKEQIFKLKNNIK